MNISAIVRRVAKIDAITNAMIEEREDLTVRLREAGLVYVGATTPEPEPEPESNYVGFQVNDVVRCIKPLEDIPVGEIGFISSITDGDCYIAGNHHELDGWIDLMDMHHFEVIYRPTKT